MGAYLHARLCERSTWLGLGVLLVAVALYAHWHHELIHHALFSIFSGIGTSIAALPGKLVMRVLGDPETLIERPYQMRIPTMTDTTASPEKVWNAFLAMKAAPGWRSELDFLASLIALLDQIADATGAPAVPAYVPPPQPVGPTVPPAL